MRREISYGSEGPLQLAFANHLGFSHQATNMGLPPCSPSKTKRLQRFRDNRLSFDRLTFAKHGLYSHCAQTSGDSSTALLCHVSPLTDSLSALPACRLVDPKQRLTDQRATLDEERLFHEETGIVRKEQVGRSRHPVGLAEPLIGMTNRNSFTRLPSGLVAPSQLPF